ncbi:3'-5' exonuclease [Acidihalobacter ferrooxydans]|uniref:3'-5' exonuclease n=1 Tax=Acidihalobacter ferrooxydans TaxID=1765967 RepID=A0A1P8UEY1_9GAMM|nr:3'-5' exonuclease [Acidihalobacter ferrooxydans]APZ42369.1 3'-5' exonuclease [Acidihalobacter ferrooxydans]
MNVMVFDIETVPDVASGRRLYDLGELSDADTAQAMFQLRMAKTGGDFLPHHLQRIVAISIVFRSRESVRVWSLGEETADEAELITRFFDGVGRYTPTLVSWNGSGFDLPVLHYRALLHGIAAPRYWEIGDDDREFRYSNYISRFHWRHIDLMDVLAGYQPRASAPLDEVATMLGLPGKMGMSGARVWDAFQGGDLSGIRNYCETDVLNTYLVYLRFEHLRGHLDATGYADEQARLRALLGEAEAPHLREFIDAWNAHGA